MSSTTNNFSSPAVQAMNLIRYVGDRVSESGEPIKNLPCDPKIANSPSKEFFIQIVKELYEQGFLRMSEPQRVSVRGMIFSFVTLSLSGWEQYEAEKRGQFAGNYGFIAMQFNDPDLEAFVQEVVKPTVKENTGYDLVDMRDVSQAGIIDNIMRVQIRDAAFVIAELPMTILARIGKLVMRKGWENLSFISVNKRSSMRKVPISTPITAQRSAGPEMMTRVFDKN